MQHKDTIHLNERENIQQNNFALVPEPSVSIRGSTITGLAVSHYYVLTGFQLFEAAANKSLLH